MPDEAVLLVSSTYEDRVHVVDPATGEVAMRIDVDPRPDARDEPAGVAVGRDGQRWYLVLGQSPPALWVFSGSDREPERTIELGELRNASRIAISPDETRAVVSEYLLAEPLEAGRAAVVDLTSGRVLGTLAPCPTPYDLAFSPRGNLLAVSCPLADMVMVIDTERFEPTASFTVTSETVSAGAPGNPASRPMGLAWSPSGDRLYVALFQERRLAAFTPDGLPFRQYDLGGSPVNLRVRGTGRYVVVAVRDEPALAVVDTRSGDVSRLPLPATFAPHAVTLSPDGRTAYVAYEGSPTERGGVVAVDLDAGTVLWDAPAGPMTTALAYRPALSAPES